jgi:hypothetical protein
MNVVSSGFRPFVFRCPERKRKQERPHQDKGRDEAAKVELADHNCLLLRFDLSVIQETPAAGKQPLARMPSPGGPTRGRRDDALQPRRPGCRRWRAYEPGG